MTSGNGNPPAQSNKAVHVVAANTGARVPWVLACTTLIEPNGGFETCFTDSQGDAILSPRMLAGRYQVRLIPVTKSRFKDTELVGEIEYLLIGPKGRPSNPELTLGTKR